VLLEETTGNRLTYPADPAVAARDGVNVVYDYFNVVPGGVTAIDDQVYQRVSFSGAYTYHVHEGLSFASKLERYEELANIALGARFDADVAWQLTPWSWLIDWFSDAGTFISNVNALSADSLVVKYGYVMHETRAERIRTLRMDPKGIGPRTIWSTSIYHRKLRHRSTPYGFGLDLGSLSPRRWAILGALGLTKAPNSLH
jgi:hypothetical protein